MRAQAGQSMAEYLVALGIGGSIIAALTLTPCTVAGSAKGCVPTLIDALHNNYEGYSAAIGDVQDYGEVDVAAPPEDEGEVEDDDSIPGDGGNDDPTETPAESLNKVNYVYDDQGNVIGTVSGSTIYDLDGNVIGEYTYNEETGEQVAVVDGEEITGVSVGSIFVDEDGNEVPLVAIVVNNQVVGFAYENDGKYFDPLKGELTDDVPDGAQAATTRPVMVRDGSGQASLFGYEVDGYIYSLSKVQVSGETYAAAKVPDGELVQMVLTQASTLISWSGYSRCIVRAVNWVDNELNGAYSFDKTEDDGSGNQVTTTQNAVVESPTNNLGYIDNADQGSGGCQGRWVLTEGATSWSLSGPF
ncbi:hypothetical protein DMO17_09810 [Aquipseudomonas alcaligenes]|uniref:Uncharacterized protein n=1 Tax=Aquipseudomonas alcaligenes TaxID=43263 RepID=A0A2V4L8Q5_AQUAC|nr:hypothetical protein [Pseudomonas alcaligenes]PYC25952.1 hypothetical protein DMO17_09810 [Pseudomonas alcaligenes]